MVLCLTKIAYVYAQMQYVLLFLVLAVNSNQFQILHSYTLATRFCALMTCVHVVSVYS